MVAAFASMEGAGAHAWIVGAAAFASMEGAGADAWIVGAAAFASMEGAGANARIVGAAFSRRTGRQEKLWAAAKAEERFRSFLGKQRLLAVKEKAKREDARAHVQQLCGREHDV